LFHFFIKEIIVFEKLYSQNAGNNHKKNLDENSFYQSLYSSELLLQQGLKKSLRQKMLIKSGLKFFSSRKLFLIL